MKYKTVWKTVVMPTMKEAIQAKASALILGKPCGPIKECKDGWEYEEWHSGPKP